MIPAPGRDPFYSFLSIPYSKMNRKPGAAEKNRRIAQKIAFNSWELHKKEGHFACRNLIPYYSKMNKPPDGTQKSRKNPVIPA